MAEIPKNTNPNIGDSFKKLLTDIWDFFHDLIDLKEGMDRKGTIQNIKNNKRMKGANAWLLMCSIMIASLGLDLNSPAVIIGAMLISPLMSPILGVGLGVGINDRETLYVSLQHFVIAIGIALFTSTFYFFFTPFGDTTDEILARTSPNTLDALVAFFGGIAGIISG
ncbi:MAG: putative membrane protein, partial [Saprospiraceae bacterium]